MLEGLRGHLESAIKRISERELSEEELEQELERLELDLIQNDVAVETAEKITADIKERLVGEKVGRLEDSQETVEEAVRNSVLGVLSEGDSFDLLKDIERKNQDGEHYSIVFIGINGVGKTTTIAKLANLLKKNEFKGVLACADTYRAGAIEQLQKHADNLSVPMVKQKYGADPASVAYDAIGHAEARDMDAVLVDTAGRQHADIDLMNELSKIVRVAEPDLVVLVVDALSGNDALAQSEMFMKEVGFDAVVLTKMDADAKGGAAVSVVDNTKKPILYLGVGQSYDDLEPFDAAAFVNDMLGDLAQG